MINIIDAIASLSHESIDLIVLIFTNNISKFPDADQIKLKRLVEALNKQVRTEKFIHALDNVTYQWEFPDAENAEEV